MEYVIGILLLVSFFGLVVYAVRGGNLMLGIFCNGYYMDGSANDWQLCLLQIRIL